MGGAAKTTATAAATTGGGYAGAREAGGGGASQRCRTGVKCSFSLFFHAAHPKRWHMTRIAPAALHAGTLWSPVLSGVPRPSHDGSPVPLTSADPVPRLSTLSRLRGRPCRLAAGRAPIQRGGGAERVLGRAHWAVRAWSGLPSVAGWAAWPWPSGRPPSPLAAVTPAAQDALAALGATPFWPQCLGARHHGTSRRGVGGAATLPRAAVAGGGQPVGARRARGPSRRGAALATRRAAAAATTSSAHRGQLARTASHAVMQRRW